MAPRRPDLSPLLLPLLGVGFGASAVLIAGTLAPGAGSSWAVPVAGEGVSAQVVGLVVCVPVFLALGVWIALRATRGAAAPNVRQQIALGGIALLAAMLALALLLHAFAGAASPAPSSGGPTLPSPGANATKTPGASGGGPIELSAPWGGPGWIAYALLFGIAGAVGLAAFFLGGTAGPEGRPGPPPARRPSPVEAVRAARAALETPGASDPRAAILALYGHLLDALGDRAGAIGPKTARELADELVRGLGVSPGVAATLTERFEEARYSQRPIGARQLDAARTAILEAVRELAPGANG